MVVVIVVLIASCRLVAETFHFLGTRTYPAQHSACTYVGRASEEAQAMAWPGRDRDRDRDRDRGRRSRRAKPEAELCGRSRGSVNEPRPKCCHRFVLFQALVTLGFFQVDVRTLCHVSRLRPLEQGGFRFVAASSRTTILLHVCSEVQEQ